MSHFPDKSLSSFFQIAKI